MFLSDYQDGAIITGVINDNFSAEVEQTKLANELRKEGFDNVFPLRSVMPLYPFDRRKFARVETISHQVEDYMEYFFVNKPLFRYLEIETVNRCNGECGFCPVNVFQKQRKYHKMSKELFKSIINQLAILDYRSNIALFSNNEPFIDERLGEFVQYARQNLPHAKLFLISNGTLITLDKFKSIIHNIDWIGIDNYLTEQMPTNIKQCVDYCLEQGISHKISYFQISKDAQRASRAGNSPNSKVLYTTELKCGLPFIDMVIRPDGKVSLCCNDALGDNTLGDLTEQTLTEVWYGEKFQNYRKSLQRGRYYVDSCRYCNFMDEHELWQNGIILYKDRDMNFPERIFPKGFFPVETKCFIMGCGDAALKFASYLTKEGVNCEGFIENEYCCAENVGIYDGLTIEEAKQRFETDLGIYIVDPGYYEDDFLYLVANGLSNIKFVFLTEHDF
ncbi:MAG: SPASM domain-containing protein [Selenomonadaceae bacterium]|nr:SPASM domain-containing protein [Selenomonadaceae bacterium]